MLLSFALVLFHILPNSILADEKRTPHILFIHSYYQGAPWTDAFHEAAINTFKREFGHIDFRAEYLDSQYTPGNKYRSFFNLVLEQKYKNYDFDAVITSDEEALSFVLFEGRSLVEGIPVVYGGVNAVPGGKATHRGGITGVTYEPSIKETLELALRLHPDAEKVIIISDTITRTGRALHSQTKEIVKKLASPDRFIFWQNLTYGDLEEKKKEAGANALLFWIGMLRNEKGVVPSVQQQISLLSTTFDIPIYSCWSHTIGYGYVGGKIVDSGKQGHLATEMAVDIINGAKADSLPVINGGLANSYVFDYVQLRRFGIQLSSLPEGSNLVNEPSKSIDIRKEYLWFMLLFVAALAVSLAFLFVLFRMKRRSAQELMDSEKKYRQFYNQAPVMLHNIDMDGRIVAVNEQWLETLGYSLAEVIGKRSLIFLTEDSQEKAKNFFPKLRKDGFVRDTQYQMIASNGALRDVLLTAYQECDAEGEIIGARAAMVDVTESNRMKSEKKRLEKQLQQAQKMEAIGTLAGGIAHDFNNILSSIFGFTELAKMRSVDDEITLRNLDHVIESGIRAKDLVQHLLTFSRNTDVEKRVLKIAPLLKETIKFISATTPSTITIESRLAHNESCILADPTQIHQVIMNLFTNAVHAMKEKGGHLDVSMENVVIVEGDNFHANHLEPGQYVRLTISDTGHGIPPDKIGRIFDPFFTTKGKGEGTGLGLSVTYGIIKEMKGYISVYSEQGTGTTFTIFFPEVSGDAIGVQDDNSNNVRKGTGRILFIDDEANIVEWTTALLLELGYTITGKTDPREALAIFESHPYDFDLVMTDLTMPHIIGTELASRISKLRPDLPIILCTGFSEGLTPGEMKRTGITKMIMKPVIVSELSQTIDECMVNGRGA